MKDTEYNKLQKDIEKLEKEIESYPAGSISTKIINGKEQYYHQWYELGKTKSKYIKKDDADNLRKTIELRKTAQQKLRELKNKLQTLSENDGLKPMLDKELKAGISFPVEITGLYNGAYIIPDKKIKPVIGQKVLITIRDIAAEPSETDLDKYINHGERLFAEDAQNYIKELRNEERV